MLVGRNLPADMVGQLIQTAVGGVFVAVALGIGSFTTFEEREREHRSLLQSSAYCYSVVNPSFRKSSQANQGMPHIPP